MTAKRKNKSATLRKAFSALGSRVVMIAMYDYHIVENNGKHSLIGMFDTLGAKQFPAHFAFFLFVKLAGLPGQHRATVELVDPSDKAASG